MAKSWIFLKIPLSPRSWILSKICPMYGEKRNAFKKCLFFWFYVQRYESFNVNIGQLLSILSTSVAVKPQLPLCSSGGLFES